MWAAWTTEYSGVPASRMHGASCALLVFRSGAFLLCLLAMDFLLYSVCASHLIVGTRGGMLLAYSLEFLLFGSSSSSLDVPLSSSAIPLINEDQKTHNSSSSCLVSFRALPSPVWKCQLGILPLFLSPIKHVRTDEQGNHSRPGTPASAHHGCLVRHGVWGGELHTRSGEWFLLLSDGQEEKATSEASVNGFFSSISSNAAEKVEPEDGYERKTASKQGDSTFSNKDAPEQNQVGVKLLRGGRFGQSKDVREPSDLNPVLDGTALLPLLGGSSRAKSESWGGGEHLLFLLARVACTGFSLERDSSLAAGRDWHIPQLVA